jgi:hypothetical protein
MNPLSILSSIVSPITGYFTKKTEAKRAIKEKQIERLKSADDAVAEWEMIQAESGKHSWKDEFWTIILSIPLILCFFPSMVPVVESGFEALEGMPEFYQYWLGVAILSSFGVRLAKR